MRPAVAAAFLAYILAGIVLAIAGFALGGKPSRLGPDQTVAGAALIVIFGLSAWFGVNARRRARLVPASLPGGLGTADGAGEGLMPVLPAPQEEFAPATRDRRAASPTSPPATRLAIWIRVLSARGMDLIAVLLITAVLFGVFFTCLDGPAARAFRHAPPCVGETNLATCVGDFTAVINGVRSPANGANFAHVSYVTNDGMINGWAQFDGNATAIARMASADETARAHLTIRIWHRSIVGAELGGSWHWTDGNPPGNTVPAVFLAVSFALLLLVLRLRVHSRAGSGPNSRTLFAEDLGQAAAAAGSIVLLAYGFWAGAILALAVLLWLGLSARQSTRGKRRMLTAPHAA
jgi:hypothetical protein